MTTLLEAAKTLIKVLELEKSQIVLSMTSGRALEQLEQAIAQEQRNKNAVPLDMMRFGGRCNIHPVNIMPCTSCEGILQRKQASKDVAQIIGDLDAKMHKSFTSQTASTNPVVSQKAAGAVDKDCDTCNNRLRRMHQEPCFSCHAYTNWEPKP